MKRAWIVVGSILTVGVIGFSTANAVSLLAHDEDVETSTFAAGDVTELDIDASNGSIEIVGDDVERITVVAEISHGLRPTRHRAEVEGSTLVVRSSCTWIPIWCGVDYHVTVPADLLITASADNGRLTVRDITGDVTADSDNGSVELVRLSGVVRASSDNGRVTGTGLRSPSIEADTDNGRVSLTFAESPTTVIATSDNGRVEVVVPDTTDTYLVEAQTDNGSTDVGVRTDPESDRTILAATDNGSVTVRYPAG
jgi:hypothetical protein